MRKFLFFVLISAFTFSCSSNKATLKAKIEGLKKGEVVLKVLEINTQKIVDTLKTDENGLLKYSAKIEGKAPNFYFLYYKEKKIASMVVLPGDNIYITTDTLGANQNIEGSQESILFLEIEKNLSLATSKFDSLSSLRAQAVLAGNKELEDTLGYELGSLYVKSKQAAIKHLYSNPGSITNIPLLYYKFPGNLPLFGDVRDVLLFQRVYDSLQPVYPQSSYLNALLDEISVRGKSDMLNSKLLDASEVGFPDISLPDTKAKVRTLSDLSGKVVILLFWSVTDVNQKIFNRDLLALYDKYSIKGLEIYQVSVDTDKTAWANTVAEQQLPWINVCDGLGSSSPAVTTYNVQKAPTLYVIDKSGSIAAKDVYDSKLESLISSLVR
ncbi:MAG: Thioredoxin Family Protein [Bacteroidetes bacterium]|nr:Thioredoxin Family Protein [Bacteroidota bacterium]